MRTGSLTIFNTGYKLAKPRKIRAKANNPAIERKAFEEKTGSGIKNSKAMRKPPKIPIDALIAKTMRISIETIFMTDVGFAPKALMMPKSLFCPAIRSIM